MASSPGNYTSLVGSSRIRRGTVSFVDPSAIASCRLEGITASGSIGRRVALAAGRICIGHSFLTRYSSHAICVPITQRLSACSDDHLSYFQAPSFRFFFFIFFFSSFSPPQSLYFVLSFSSNLFCTSARHTRGNLSRRSDGFSAIFWLAAPVIGRLPWPVMYAETFAPRPVIIHEGLKVAGLKF